MPEYNLSTEPVLNENPNRSVFPGNFVTEKQREIFILPQWAYPASYILIFMKGGEISLFQDSKFLDEGLNGSRTWLWLDYDGNEIITRWIFAL